MTKRRFNNTLSNGVELIRGLLTDGEWAIFEPFVAAAGPLRDRPPRDHRRMLDTLFWVARTSVPWRDLPAELSSWNSVHRRFRRWAVSGLWDALLQALADAGGRADALQMHDSIIVRAHHCSVGGKWPPRRRPSAAPAEASRPKSTPGPTPRAYLSVWC